MAKKKKAKKAVAKNGHDSLREVEQLLYRQAECLDGKRWQEFIDLFTADGTYWMPAAPEQTTGEGVPSIFWEDRDLMTVRLKRLTHPRAWSQQTAWGTNHVVGQGSHGTRRFVIRMHVPAFTFSNTTSSISFRMR